MPPEAFLTEDRCLVDIDLEHTTTGRNQREFGNDVLIIAQEVIRCAHGAARIVSTKAVSDTDGQVLGHVVRLILRISEDRVTLVEVRLDRLDLVWRTNERVDLGSFGREPISCR